MYAVQRHRPSHPDTKRTASEVSLAKTGEGAPQLSPLTAHVFLPRLQPRQEPKRLQPQQHERRWHVRAARPAYATDAQPTCIASYPLSGVSPPMFRVAPVRNFMRPPFNTSTVASPTSPLIAEPRGGNDGGANGSNDDAAEAAHISARHGCAHLYHKPVLLQAQPLRVLLPVQAEAAGDDAQETDKYAESGGGGFLSVITIVTFVHRKRWPSVRRRR